MNELAIPSRPKQYGPESCIPDQTRCWRAHVFPLLLILTLIWIIYANSFKGAWILDDDPNIVSNSNVHMKTLDWKEIKKAASGTKNGRIDRPLAFLSFGLNYYFNGLNPWGYHLVNLTIHSFSAIFLYLFICQTLNLPILKVSHTCHAASIALLSTALWATHPIHVTSVTYIVQRMASMAAMFYIISMYCYLKGRTSGKGRPKIVWYILCTLSGFLALISKENAIMLPLVLYLYDILLIQGIKLQRLKKQLLIGIIPLFFLLIFAFAISNPFNFLSGYVDREFTLKERLLTQPRVLLFYLSLLLYPITDRFTLIYDIPISTSLFTPWTTVPSIIFWIGWILSGVLFIKKKPLLSFCLLFFAINHLIESSILPLELVFEHRNYLPSIVIFILIGNIILWATERFSQNLLIVIPICIIFIINITGQSYSVIKRNSLFQSALYLWKDNADKYPEISRPINNLGKAYYDLGLLEIAKQTFIREIMIGRYHRRELLAVSLNNLGNCYLIENDSNKAIQFYKQALVVAPDYFLPKYNLIYAFLQVGDLKKAEQILSSLFIKNSENATLISLRSFFLLKKKKYREAIKLAFKTICSDEKSSLALKVLAQAYYSIGNFGFSIKYWEKYELLNPGQIEPLLALLNLANVTQNDFLLRKIAKKLISFEEHKEFDNLISDFYKNNELYVFSISNINIPSLIRRALDLELEDISKLKFNHNRE